MSIQNRSERLLACATECLATTLTQREGPSCDHQVVIPAECCYGNLQSLLIAIHPPPPPPPPPLTHTHTQAFYQLCLNNRSLSTASHDGSGLVPLNENLTCAGFVCTDPMPGYIHNNSHLCGNEFCFQPYSFVCVLPLEILWYIIYWLFFVLSW